MTEQSEAWMWNRDAEIVKIKHLENYEIPVSSDKYWLWWILYIAVWMNDERDEDYMIVNTVDCSQLQTMIFKWWYASDSISMYSSEFRT